MSKQKDVPVLMEIREIATRTLKQNWKYYIVYFVCGIAAHRMGQWLQLYTD
jgi:hypothetical protein